MAGLLAAAAVALSTPASAHEFAGYFDYGRTELSPRGYQMAREAASYAQDRQRLRLIVTGHMDTAEAEEFSDELSRRRAQAIATELVSLGVDPARIEMIGYGASRLARPTPASTREPLNRRVLVDVRLPPSSVGGS
jgi:outer membrane protein OmpA-like peptidoglycan-associated protein